MSAHDSSPSMELECPANSSNAETSESAASPCDFGKNGGFAWRRSRSLGLGPVERDAGLGDSTDDEYEEVDLRFMFADSVEAESLQEENNFIESSYEHASSLSRKHRALYHRGLSKEYQPKVFEDIVGHDVIIRALSNAIRWKRISPLYLFHGPGGTGKTSAARMFAMALNCESSAALPMKPCYGCTACSHSLYTAESCSGNESSCFENIRTFLRSTTHNETSSYVKVFIIDNELSSAAEFWPWGDLLNLVQGLEDKRCVFILISEDARAVPRAVSSRCQKFNFSKLRDTDVLLKLSRIVAQEGIEIGKDALKLIASKADGNLREAENLLDQLVLLDLKINTSMIQQLVGLVPRSKLIRLLEAAMSGSSTEAVKYTRDLIASGIDQLALVLQLASLVTELLADSCSTSLLALKGNKQPEKLCRTLQILIKTEKKLRMLLCNHTTWVTAAVLQIASNGVSHQIPTDENSDSPERLVVKDMHSIRHPDNTESSKTRQQPFTSLIENLSNSIINPSADPKSIDMDELWHNILERIQTKGHRDFLQSRAKLISLTASRANAIVHLMLEHSEDVSDESIENTLKEALGCPVTLNISRGQYSNTLRQETLFTQISRPRKEMVASMDGRELVKPRVKHESVPMVESKLRSTKFQNNAQMFAEGTEHGVSMVQSGQDPFPSGHLIREGRESSCKDLKVNHSGRDQSFQSAIAKATELKLRLLSISSIPLTDASIEPYSQDLLFEEANPDRKQRGRHSKLYKDFLRPTQHRRSVYYINRRLNRSQSDTENFCRGENMKVNEERMGLPTRSYLSKRAYSCKDFNIINSIINAGQSDWK